MFGRCRMGIDCAIAYQTEQMKQLLIFFLAALPVLMSCNKALTPEEAGALRQVIESKEYTFRVTSVNPPGGRNIQLSPGYDLRVSDHTVSVTLPYFGRAYFPPMDPSQGGFRFSSKQYQYSANMNDKGTWDIVIAPEDVPDVQQLRLTVTSAGNATLFVTSFSRQAISYYGDVGRNAETGKQ